MPTHKLTIELLVDIAHIGRKGSIIEVSSSQAKNSLIPRGLAREVTPERLKKLESDKKRSEDQLRMRLEKAFEIQKMLDGQVLPFTLKGKGTKVFGGLSEHDISKRISEKYGISFEKGDIKLPNKTHIKSTGTYLVYIHITRDTHAKIVVEVSLEA